MTAEAPTAIPIIKPRSVSSSPLSLFGGTRQQKECQGKHFYFPIQEYLYRKIPPPEPKKQ